MSISRVKPNNCSGCAACVQKCPFHAVKLCTDHEGFLYPSIDYSLCVNCNICEFVCPTLHFRTNEKKTEDVAFGFNANDSIRADSSSGGFFSVLAKYVMDNNGYVAGVSLSEDCRFTEYTIINDVSELSKITKSKYVQCTTDKVYKQILDLLEDNKTVLFSGTPCQVNALKLFLGNDYENLILVDIICHGVPSPLVWRMYCNEIEKSNRRKIINVNFRNKQKGWNVFGLSLEFEGEKGKKYYGDKYSDPYLRLFLKNVFLRPSCYNCNCKRPNIAADITIGDLWGAEKVAPSLFDDKGTSLVILNSEKGMRLFDRIKHLGVFEPLDYENAVKRNHALYSSVARPKERDSFFADLDKYSIRELAMKYDQKDTRTVIRIALRRNKCWRIIKQVILKFKQYK